MKSSTIKSLLPIIIIAGAIVAAVIIVAARKPPETVEPDEKAFLIEAEPILFEDINFTVHSQGTVEPKVKTNISAQVNGQVVYVDDKFIAGGMFKKGDLLIRLEQADYLTSVKSAEAEVARVEAALQQEKALGKVAAEEWRTIRNTKPSELALRKPQLAKELANLSAAEASLERAKRNLQRTNIRAPYDGLVKSRNVNLGQFVGAGSQLGEIYATDVAEVRLPLSDNDMAYLDQVSSSPSSNQMVLHTQLAGHKVQWPARLVRTEGVLDPRRRVIYAVAQVNDPYQRNQTSDAAELQFGRFVKADIVGKAASNLVVMPRRLLRLDGTVLTVNSERKLNIKPVSVIKADAKYAYIGSGLQDDDMLVTSAVPYPYQGMPVRLSEDDPKKDEASETVEKSKTDDAIAKENE